MDDIAIFMDYSIKHLVFTVPSQSKCGIVESPFNGFELLIFNVLQQNINIWGMFLGDDFNKTGITDNQ